MDQNRINLEKRQSSNLSTPLLILKTPQSSTPLGSQLQLQYLARQTEICPKFHAFSYTYNYSPLGFSPSCSSYYLYGAGDSPSRSKDLRELHNLVIKSDWNITLFFLCRTGSLDGHSSQNSNLSTIPQPAWNCPDSKSEVIKILQQFRQHSVMESPTAQ